MPIRGNWSVLLDATERTVLHVSILRLSGAQDGLVLTRCVRKLVLFPLDPIFQAFSITSSGRNLGLHLFPRHVGGHNRRKDLLLRGSKTRFEVSGGQRLARVP